MAKTKKTSKKTVKPTGKAKPSKITLTKAAADETTEIICILDRSTSIRTSGLVEKTIEGYNSFIHEQKKLPGKAKFTMCLFDGGPDIGPTYEIVHDGVDLQSVPDLDTTTFVAKGWTALYDAVGITLDNVQARFKKEGSPDKVVVLIMTDGEENSSKEYDQKDVLQTIRHLRDNDRWGFVFIGANIDAFQAGGDIGVSRGSTMSYSNDAMGVKKAYMRMSASVSMLRSMDSTDIMFGASLDNLVTPDDKDEEENP